VASQVGSARNRLRTFLDTDILVYADDPRDPEKQSRADMLLTEHLQERTGILSIQVLQEYFSTSTGKLRLSADLAKQRIEKFAMLYVVEPRVDDLLAAIDIHRLHRLSFWDALIVRSAKIAGCSVLLTEDMQHGQVIDGVRIVNPFL
jgi:predicted nucleic acid-binding protein